MKPLSIVWRFWEQPVATEMDIVLEMCDQSCDLNLAGFDRRTLNYEILKKDYGNLEINSRIFDESLSIAQKTDYLRMLLLWNYGGVWFDYDTIFLPRVSEQLKIGFESNSIFSFGGFSMAAFGGPPRHPYFEMCLSQITEKLDSGVHLDYTSLGSEVMYESIKDFEYKELEGGFWFTSFDKWSEFFEEKEKIELGSKSLIFLYNKMMKDAASNVSREFLMANPKIAISQMFNASGVLNYE